MRRACTCISALTVIAVLAVAPVAAAGTARTFGSFGDFETGYTEKIRFLADSGERNVVRLRDAGEIVVDEYQTTQLVRVIDRGAPVRPGPGCSRETVRSVICEVAGDGGLTARLGDRDDSLAAYRSFAAIVAEGGAGSDRLRGTGRSDDLDGGPGADHVTALPGGDVIRDADGGAADVLDGGKGGTDTVDYSERLKDTRVDLATDLVTARGERDRVPGIESVVVGTGDDLVLGDSAPNVFEERDGTFFEGFNGGAPPVRSGDDRFLGRGGDDDMLSLGGDDRLVGGAGNDYLGCHVEIRQRCTILGDAGTDTLSGSGGADILRGGSGRDDISGAPGDDRLVGGPGPDGLFGWRGDDVFFTRDRMPDRIAGARGRDRARIDGGLDDLRSVEARF